MCDAPATMPYIYATALPGDIVKLGYGSTKMRARAAQTYYVERVQVLAQWFTNEPVKDEKRAHRACKAWHVRGELFKVPTDWLDIEHPLVARVTDLLGYSPVKEGSAPCDRGAAPSIEVSSQAGTSL